MLSGYNKYDRALFILLAALFSGNMGGVLLLPRTVSILFLPLLLCTTPIKDMITVPRSLFAIWLVWGSISLIWTPNPADGFTQLLLLIFNIFYAYEILVFALYSTNCFKIIAFGWLIALSVNNAIGIWEILTDNHLSVSKFGNEHSLMVGGEHIIMRYANGFFSNYNAFVTFICCSLPFLYYLFFNAEKRFYKTTIIVNVLISIYILFMNGSRGGILSLAIISVVFLFRLIKEGNNKWLAIGFFSVFIAFVAYSWDSLSYVVVGRQSAINGIEEEARFSVWANCLEVLVDTFFLGTGIGGVTDAMLKHSHIGAVLAPHNAFFEILIQYGIIVFSIFILLIKDIIVATKGCLDYTIKAVIFSSLLAMPFIFIINSVYLINPFFWALMASLFIFAKYPQLDYYLLDETDLPVLEHINA